MKIMNEIINPIIPQSSGVKYHPVIIVLSWLIFTAIVIFVSIGIGRYAANRFGGNKKKTVLAFVFCSVAVAGLLFCFFGLSVKSITGSIFCLLLLTASTSDLKTRECDDWLSVMILLTGLIGMEVQTIPLRLVSMILMALLMLIPPFFSKDGIGGADIKITASSAFLLGLQRGLLGLTVGLLFAVLIHAVWQKDKKAGFPLVPYLAVPFMAAYFI